MAKRRMTSQDQWDLVLFLAILVAALLGGAVLWKAKGTSKMAAFATDTPARLVALPQPQQAELRVSEPSSSMLANLLPTTSLPLPSDRLAAADNSADQPAKPAKLTAKPAPDIKWYNGEKYHYVRTLHMRVTAYAPDARCCWPFPGTTTASGLSVKTNRGKLVAADTNVLPFHALVSVPGYHAGESVPVLDRGAAIKGHKLDVLLPTFEMAQNWGAKTLDVKVYVQE